MNNKLSYVAILALCTLLPRSAFALTFISKSVCPGFEDGKVHADCVPDFIAHVIAEVFSFTGALSVIMIIWGGFEYALGQLVGGKEKGEKRIRYGILGMIVSGFAFFIVRFVIFTLQTGI